MLILLAGIGVGALGESGSAEQAAPVRAVAPMVARDGEAPPPPTPTPMPPPPAIAAAPARCFEPRGDVTGFDVRPADGDSVLRNCQVVAYYGYPGVPGLGVLGEGTEVEMLARLAPHYALALVSTRGRPMVDAFLETYRLGPWFGSVVTAETCFRAKPAPDPLLHAARELGFAPEACVMVGDTTVDMRAARAAGTQAIGVLCGFGEEAELRRSGAGFILPSTADLTAVL